MRPQFAWIKNGALAIWGIPALACILLVWYTATNAVNVLYSDEFAFVADISWIHAGIYNLEDAARMHNEHRIFFPRLLLLGLGALSRFDARWEMVASALLICACIVLLVGKCRRPVVAALVSLIFFNLRQSENLFIGFQVCLPLCAVSIIGALILLDMSPLSRRAFGAAAVCGIIASFSFANGLMIWPCGLLLLVYRRASREKAWTWSITGIIVIVAFLTGTTGGPPQPGSAFWTQHPFQTLIYAIANQGAFFSEPIGIVIIQGVVVVTAEVFFIYLALRHRQEQLGFPLACIAFGLLTSLLIAKGRALLGVDQALASRYVTLTDIGLAGSVIGYYHLLNGATLRWRRAATAGAMAIGLAIAWAYAKEQRLDIAYETQFRAAQLAESALLKNASAVDDATLLSTTHYVDAPYLRQALFFLREQHLSEFTGS